MIFFRSFLVTVLYRQKKQTQHNEPKQNTVKNILAKPEFLRKKIGKNSNFLTLTIETQRNFSSRRSGDETFPCIEISCPRFWAFWKILLDPSDIQTRQIFFKSLFMLTELCVCLNCTGKLLSKSFAQVFIAWFLRFSC